MLEASVVARRVALETGGIATYELLIAGLMGAAVLILIASLLSMTINERKRELGLLRSIGATKRFVSRIVMTEVAVVSILGSVVGLSLGAAALFLSEQYLSTSYSVSFIQPDFLELIQFALTSLVLGVAIGVAAATYPAYVASGMDPYDAVRRGE
jgi:putative ABC transport system permease protein